MKKIQVSFACDADLKVVGKQLLELSEMEDVQFYCCFLNKKMVAEKGFSMDIVNLLDCTIGCNLVWVADGFGTYDEFMANIDISRKLVAGIIDHLYMLDSNTAKGVSREIELFTAGRVKLL